MKIPCWFLLLVTSQKIRCFLNDFLAGDGCVLRTHTHVRCYISRDEKKSVVVVYEAPLMTYVVTASSAPLHKCAYIEYTKSQVSNVSYYRHRLGWLLAGFWMHRTLKGVRKWWGLGMWRYIWRCICSHSIANTFFAFLEPVCTWLWECFPILKAAPLDFLAMSNVSKSYTTSTINSTPQSGVVVS